MDNSMVKISSNWNQIGGCPFSQSFQLLTADTDFFKRPDLDDIVNEEKSILLSKSKSSDFCEMSIGIYPHFKIQCLSLVCNVSKIEIFFGPIKEYLETAYGVSVDGSDDQFKSYRYDIEVEKSGITDLTLKFLTHSSDVCVFGIILFCAPNPNGITTLLPSSDCLNIDNKSKEDSNKSKQLVELMKLLSNPLKTNNATLEKLKIAEKDPSTHQLNNDILYQLQSYIDERFRKLEERLEKIEETQMRKLDDILNRLENLK